MRIEQSQVALASSRTASVTDTSQSKIEAWVGKRPSSAGAAGIASQARGIEETTAAAVARLSAQAVAAARDASRLAVQTSVASPATASSAGAPDPNEPTITDPNLLAMIMFIERITGHKVHLIHSGDVRTDAEAASAEAGRRAADAVATAAGDRSAPAQPVGWGVEITARQVHQESETTAFRASGQIVTADGRAIGFNYAVEMHRDLTQTTTIDIQAGDAVKKVDPIALNLSGGPVALSSTRSSFDINSDGKAEQVALPAAGTYFVALDRNGNGKIDSGSELFGPATGNGFTELKTLDTDHNGWIDEGDAAYSRLELWSGADGGLTSLAAAGVGALYVGQSASTRFDIRSAGNETLGQVVSSSVYLGENGSPGALQQVDLTA
jgi:hypothetical protein